jgi:hypothetical protein
MRKTWTLWLAALGAASALTLAILDAPAVEALAELEPLATAIGNLMPLLLTSLVIYFIPLLVAKARRPPAIAGNRRPQPLRRVDGHRLDRGPRLGLHQADARDPGEIKGENNAMYGISPAIIATLAVLAAPAMAESTVQRDAPTTRFYDSRGNLTGSATTYGNQTNFYAPNGTHTGTATQKGGR